MDSARNYAKESNESNRDSSRPSSSTSVSSVGQNTPCYYINSLAIRQEILRFENVHPSIYAIYDLLDLINGADGQLIAQRVRDHVVCIEGKKIVLFFYCLFGKKKLFID